MSDPSHAIAVATDALDRALVSGDAALAASFFTSDAILGESGIDDVAGREAILQFLVIGDTKRRVTHHRLHRDELHVFGDFALERGWFEETKVRFDSPDVPVHERGRTMTLWRRDADDAWRIHRLVISDLPLDPRR